MQYEGDVYRPPSEASSLIIQLTIGCARNNCTFCSMYKEKKFRIRPVDEVIADLEECREPYGKYVKRIFLADGDAMVVSTDILLEVIAKCYELYPNLQRVSVYAAPKDVLLKSPDDLRRLKAAGLDIAYIGLESGDDAILKNVKKGATAEEITEACLKLKEARIAVSMTVISGLGGRSLMRQHALNSARVISAVKPEYAALLTLMIHPGTELEAELKEGRFQLLSPEEILDETRLFLSNVDSEGTVFRSNHASNYVNLSGTLNSDIPDMLKKIDAALSARSFKPESWRGF